MPHTRGSKGSKGERGQREQREKMGQKKRKDAAFVNATGAFAYGAHAVTYAFSLRLHTLRYATRSVCLADTVSLPPLPLHSLHPSALFRCNKQ